MRTTYVYTFAWYKNGVLIPNSNWANYLVKSDEVGSSLTAAVTISDTSAPDSTWTIRSTVSIVVLKDFTFLKNPVLVGTGKVNTDHAMDMQVSEPGVTVSYQWLLGTLVLSRDAVYRPDDLVLYEWIRCLVTFQKPGYRTSTAGPFSVFIRS